MGDNGTIQKCTKKPSPREKLFIDSYLKHLNASQAARDAGYSEKSARDMGCELLKREHVKRQIDEIFAQNREKVDIGYLIEELLRTVRDCEVGHPTRMKAIELLGRANSMYANERGETIPAININVVGQYPTAPVQVVENTPLSSPSPQIECPNDPDNDD